MCASRILFTPLRARYESFSTTLGLGGQFLRTGADSVAVLDTAATANLARFQWLGHHKKFLGREGFPRISTYLACAPFNFGDGRLGEARYAADPPVGIADCRGKFAASVLEADIPALLRKGVLGARGAQSDVSREISTHRKQGGDILLEVSQMEHYVLGVDAFAGGRSKSATGPSFRPLIVNGPFRGDVRIYSTARNAKDGLTVSNLQLTFQLAE